MRVTWTQVLQYHNGWSDYTEKSKWPVGRIYRTEGWITSQAGQSRTAQEGVRFHHAIQNSTQFKNDELLISGVFHLIFSDRSWQLVAETLKSKTWGKGGLLLTYDYLIYFLIKNLGSHFRVSLLGFFLLFRPNHVLYCLPMLFLPILKSHPSIKEGPAQNYWFWEGFPIFDPFPNLNSFKTALLVGNSIVNL